MLHRIRMSKEKKDCLELVKKIVDNARASSSAELDLIERAKLFRNLIENVNPAHIDFLSAHLVQIRICLRKMEEYFHNNSGSSLLVPTLADQLTQATEDLQLGSTFAAYLRTLSVEKCQEFPLDNIGLLLFGKIMSSAPRNEVEHLILQRIGAHRHLFENLNDTVVSVLGDEFHPLIESCEEIHAYFAEVISAGLSAVRHEGKANGINFRFTECIRRIQSKLDSPRSITDVDQSASSNNVGMVSNVRDGLTFDRGNCLGEGTFGTVFQGLHRGTIVAVKEMKKYYKTDEDEEYAKKTFSKEAKILHRCQGHPAIVRFYGCDTSHPQSLIVMEMAYCSLFQALYVNRYKAVKVFSLTRKIEMLIECCDCFKWLHDRKIVHRDIKIDNILLSATDEIKIADFGIGKIIDESTTSNGIDPRGTYYYMAPELICVRLRPLKYNQSTDVYSFAVTINEFLNGCRPYPKDLNFLPTMIGNSINTRPSLFVHTSQVFNESVATMLKKGWHEKSIERPTFQEIMQMLTNLKTLV